MLKWHIIYLIWFYTFRLVETTLLRRHGYVFRLEYENFLERYKMLSTRTWPHWSGDGSVDGVTCLLRDLPISANEYAFGRTKIYIRTSKTVRLTNIFEILFESFILTRLFTFVFVLHLNSTYLPFVTTFC